MRTLPLALLALSGCFPAGAECDVDSDCTAGACTRTHECIEGTLVDARVHWTLAGEPASETTCAGIDHMSIAFADSETDDRTSYSPVPCELGMATYDKMPPRFDTVAINAHAADDRVLASATAGLLPGLNQVDFDLAP
jgi:hypothetical protein